jgi:hypothetical protein
MPETLLKLCGRLLAGMLAHCKLTWLSHRGGIAGIDEMSSTFFPLGTSYPAKARGFGLQLIRKIASS